MIKNIVVLATLFSMVDAAILFHRAFYSRSGCPESSYESAYTYAFSDDNKAKHNYCLKLKDGAASLYEDSTRIFGSGGRWRFRELAYADYMQL